MSYYFQMKMRKQMVQVNREIVSGNRSYIGKNSCSVAPIWRGNVQGVGKAS